LHPYCINAIITFLGQKTNKKVKPMEEQIKAKLEQIRPMLQADGGDLEVVEIDGSLVKLRLKGACGGCPHATMTIKQGIERALKDDIDESIVVERVE
jgi:Fe-S cluster biogenesis protein NfuA